MYSNTYHSQLTGQMSVKKKKLLKNRNLKLESTVTDII